MSTIDSVGIARKFGYEGGAAARTRFTGQGQSMRIVMIGAGYVGLVSGTCLADFGHEVVCVDTDEEKVASLRDGRVPIYEPGLTDLVLVQSERRTSVLHHQV